MVWIQMASELRLYLEHPLGEGQSVPLSREQAHYLFGVMRRGVGEVLEVFNGRDGSFGACVREVGRRGGTVEIVAKRADLQLPPDLWLVFAPIKKARTDFIVEKAAEMGVRRVQPVQTAFTNADRIRRDRLQAHAIEATEQCGGNFVPDVADIVPLRTLLAAWDSARQILFCDEARAGGTSDIAAMDAPWAILIGPEGGFAPCERDMLHALPQAHPVALGPRILRADTAAVAAMTLWQRALGDWQ